MAEMHAKTPLSTALVDARQAATYLGCSVQWLAVLRMRRAGPAYVKHGAWIRYRIADLDSWTEQHRVAATGTERTVGMPQ